MSTYRQKINGAYREKFMTSLPTSAGVYFVYSGVYKGGTIYPKKLIYIGESSDINNRVNNNHEHFDDWKDEVENGETLCFSYTEVSDVDVDDGQNRKRVEAAYIVKHQPPVNIKHKESFNHPDTRIISDPVWDSIGTSYLKPDFSVSRGDLTNY